MRDTSIQSPNKKLTCVFFKPLAFALTTALSATLAPLALAQSFDVVLGGRTLGDLTYAAKGTDATLKSTLGNTPLGVFDGTFTASSTHTDGRQIFDGLSAASRKSRRVQVTLRGGTALDTTVEPMSEMTPLSNPARVPKGVMDPVQAFGALITAPDCPPEIVIYDGRRAIALIPGDTTLDGDTQTCAIAYRVIAGPGHLSPLKIAKAKMKLTYVTAGGTRMLSQMDIRSGVFKLVLARSD